MTAVYDARTGSGDVDTLDVPGPGAAADSDHREPTTTGHRVVAHRVAFGGLLAATAALYLIGLSISGWANQFYAAAAQAGSRSWTAFLFGSLDASNFITVDKPPAALWVMDVSVKIFGVNSWSVLVPQALEGVAAVALLYAAVRRVSGPTAGLLAGAALATTPVAALMFRFDNPDALLVLLLTAAAYAVVRAIDGARPRWLVLAGALIGFAFLTKMLQGLLVVPGFAAAYLIAAPTTLRRRLLHLLAGGVAMIVAGGWWVALVELWPAGSRPYIGGSTNNSVLELIFGYNGVGRLTGSDNNGAVGGFGGTGTTGGGGFSSGQTGLTRLFGDEMGAQISWLLPAALISLLVVGWFTLQRVGAGPLDRSDPLRASLVVWGGWLVVTGVVFSFASGIIHAYYTVALAPAIAALVGLGTAQLWLRRTHIAARLGLVAMIVASTAWAIVLLGRADWHPELRWVVGVAGLLCAAAVVGDRWLRTRVMTGLVATSLAVTMLAAPTAYAVQTASSAHTGALPTAGPASGGFGFGGGRPGSAGGFRGAPGGPGGPGGSGTPGGSSSSGGTGGRFAPPGSSTSTTGSGTAFPGALPGAGGGTGGSVTGAGSLFGGGTGASGSAAGSNGSRSHALGPGGVTGGGGMGGLGGATTVSTALKAALVSDAGEYRWVAATTSDNEAASLELGTGQSVMALGGYNGTDPAITLAAFQRLVAAGKIHYYVADSQGFIGSTAANTSTAYRIQQWITAHYTARTIGATTVYDLTSAR